MADRLYAIRWDTGDTDSDLSQGEVIRIVDQHGCRWVESEIVNDRGVRVGRVWRQDSF